MVYVGDTVCPDCSGELIFFDRVKRVVKLGDGEKEWIYIRRLRCKNCKKLHRELPEYLIPYKQYDKEIISDVKHGVIDQDTYGYENYPCEMTMKRWKNQNEKNPGKEN